MAAISTTIRRWCDQCSEFTKSRIDRWGNEVCSRCCPPSKDDQ